MPRFKKFWKNFGTYKFDPKIEFFSALSCSARIEILNLLRDGEKSVNEIAEKLKVDKSVASRHLAILRQIGIVNAKKDGINVYYSVTSEKIFKIIDLITDFLKEINKIKQSNL